MVCLLAAGLGAIALLVLGLSLNPPASVVRESLAGAPRAGGPADAVAGGGRRGGRRGAALRSRWSCRAKGVSPFWGRLLDLAEGAVLLALVPLCLAVLDVYGAARGMASG